MLPRILVVPMRASLLLLVALAALPLAAAEEMTVGYPMGISVIGGPLIHAPVGESTTVVVQLHNGHPSEARTIRVSIVDMEHLTEGAAAGEGMGTRGIDEVVTVPPLGEAQWRVELLPRGTGSKWRITLGTTEDIEAPASPVTSFEVDTRPSLLQKFGALALVGAGGAAGAGLGALLVWRPEIRGALALPFIGLYTRLRRADALSNAKRERIYALVRETPGIGYAEMMRATKLGAGVLVHHLRILEREKLVVSRRYGLRRRIFPAGDATAAAASPSAAQERVLDALRSAPLTQSELRERLELSQQGVSYHIQRLAREGRIREEQVGGERRWRAIDGGDGGAPTH